MAQEIADSTLLDTWGSGGNIVEPDISKIIEGWQLGEQPPHEYMNWLQNTFGSKLNHILKNGVASWNNETEYLAGSSAQHNSNVWLCKTTNTNSAPTDANANWKRIITVESLADLSDDYVATTGDQTIAGIKTFSSNPLNTASQSTNANALTKYSAVVKNSGNETIAGIKTFSSFPITPSSAPETDYQVANKKYVDDNAISLATANSYDLGVGQTYQNVLSSRSNNVTYTNTTGRPIFCMFTGNQSDQHQSYLYINGVNVSIYSNGAGYDRTNFFFVVPAGSTYRIYTTGSQSAYSLYYELR